MKWHKKNKKNFIVPCKKFGSPDQGKAQQLQEWCYRFLWVCAVLSFVQTAWYGCQCLIFLMCTQMLRHVIAHGGAVRTLYVSALKVDSGRQIPLLHQGVRQIPLLHQGVNSVLLLVLCLSFRSDALPTELSHPLCLSYQSDTLPAELSHLLCLSFRSVPVISV